MWCSSDAVRKDLNVLTHLSVLLQSQNSALDLTLTTLLTDLHAINGKQIMYEPEIQVF
jgi:hypothetical protein